MGRQAPRPASLALRAALERSAPRTELAAVQSVWREAVGEAVAAQAEPVTEREGEITVRCKTATWAEELSLMEEQLLDRLRELLGEGAPSRLKCLAG
jgi:predicted nucleic acid-binding Zn ribbon protein